MPNASEVITDGSNVLGESLMVIPNPAPVVGESDKYSMVLSMVQDGKSIDYPVDLKFTDVKGTVAADYQKYLEEKWVKSLRKKYKVKVNKEILKTVNNHD